MSARKDFAAGAFSILPVLAAAFPIALLFGTLSVARGLSVAETALMSMTVFAGALQFVAIDQWGDPVPVGLLAFTALVVNIRHVLMGASLGRSLGGFSPAQKYAGMFLLTDEGWAFAEQRARKGALTPAFYFGAGLALWCVWNIGTLAGALLGTGLGDTAAFGFDFAFAAVFIAILTGFWSDWRTGAVLLASGVVSALVKLSVSGAWYIMAGALAGIIVAALLHADRDPPGDTDGLMPS
jgi:4-azaleucine resistance transporter AzlC